MFSSMSGTKQSRTSRACEGCRRRKVKCSGGTVCEGCIKFNESCVYRQHYRALKGYPIKIVRNPSDRSKHRKSSAGVSSIEKSSPIGITEISSRKRHSTSSSSSSFSSASSSPVETTSLFNPIIFTPPILSNGKTYETPPSPSLSHSPLSDCTLLPQGPLSNTTTTPPAAPPITTTATTTISIAQLIRDIIHSIPSSSPTLKLVSSTHLFPQNSRSPLPAPNSVPALAQSQASQSQMLSCLRKFFEMHHGVFPMLDPDDWYGKAKTAWIAIEYGSILSFNQIELAIVYLLVALGGRECPDLKEWAMEYYTRAKKIIPNAMEAPMCLNITQYIFLLSLFESTEDQFEALSLSETAINFANSLGLRTFVDTTKYADLPGLNALESYRTWMCVYLWNKLLSLATNTSVGLPMQKSSNMNERAFKHIGYNSNGLASRLKMLNLINTSDPFPSIDNSDSMESQLAVLGSEPKSRSEFTGSELEWLHQRITYWYTLVSIYKPSLSSAGNDWKEGATKCYESATKLADLIMSNPVTLFESGVCNLLIDQCTAIFLYHALYTSSSEPQEAIAQLMACVQYLNCTDPMVTTFLQSMAAATATPGSSNKPSGFIQENTVDRITFAKSMTKPRLPPTHSSSTSPVTSSFFRRLSSTPTHYESFASSSRKRSYPSIQSLPTRQQQQQQSRGMSISSTTSGTPPSSWSSSPRRSTSPPHSPCSSPGTSTFYGSANSASKTLTAPVPIEPKFQTFNNISNTNTNPKTGEEGNDVRVWNKVLKIFI